MFAVAKAIRSILLGAQIDAAEVSWSFSITYSDRIQSKNEVTYHTDLTRVIANEQGVARKFEAVVRTETGSLRSVEEFEIMHPIRQTRVSRWRMFEKICVLATTFAELNIADSMAEVEGTKLSSTTCTNTILAESASWLLLAMPTRAETSLLSS